MNKRIPPYKKAKRLESSEKLRSEFLDKLVNKISDPNYKPTGLERELIDSILERENQI